MKTDKNQVTKTVEENVIHSRLNLENYNEPENANFVRCVNFMVTMIEKYGHEVDLLGNNI
ncbi:hypothetical protein DSECCO2_231050 [anaerobic digester metagenome]